jgi:hypothetical protein
MSIETARGIGDEAADAMDRAVAALMKRAAPRFAAQVPMLDVGPDGRVLPTTDNVNRVNAILDNMRSSLFDDEYLAAVADYIDGLNQVSTTVSAALRELGADEDLMNTIAKRSKLAVASALLDPSSFRDLFGAISSQLINGIATAASITAVSDGVRQVTEA